MSKWKRFEYYLSKEKKSLISGPFGSNISSKYFVNEGIPVIRGNNLTFNYQKFVDNGFVFITEEKAEELNCYAYPDDIVFTAAGTIGQVGLITSNLKYKRYTISNKQIRATLDRSIIDVNFAYLILNSDFVRNQIIKGNTGSTIPLINLSTIRNLLIPEFDLSTQRKIAAVLTALDDKIEFNNKINAELEAMAKTIYDYWFVQFDFPDKNGKPYKSSGGKMVYNDKLKREIPEGWEEKKLMDFIAADKNGDWGKEELEGNYKVKVECIRGTDINGINGKGETNTPIRFILEKNESKILATNDLVIEISGGSPTQSTGRLAYITEELIKRFENPLICSNFCKAVSLKEENSLFYFIYSWNKAYENGVFFGFEGKTSGIKNLLFDTLVSQYLIVDPSKDLLDKFQDKVTLFEKQRQKNLKQKQQLSNLRDWLLPMLMNGQVSVADLNEQSNGSSISKSQKRKEKV